MNNLFDDPIREDEDITRNLIGKVGKKRYKFTMNRYTKRAVIITSIIFCVIIVMLVSLWSSEVELLQSNIKEEVYRVVATRDIEPGEVITFNNVERVIIQNVLEIEGMVYRLNKEDKYVETVRNSRSEHDFIPAISEKDGRWAIGRKAKEKIYKGEILLIQRLEEV